MALELRRLLSQARWSTCNQVIQLVNQASVLGPSRWWIFLNSEGWKEVDDNGDANPEMKLLVGMVD